ncbi:MAG: T9SS type A sorting domain-containing protein, partial [Paludibacteraceae bacterium]|nr:T9SS type A sorting domain-containing protein [Paludibacteraceae bacterium]
STTQDVSDSIYTAHVYVLAAVSSEIYDTVCANQPYTNGEWNLQNPRSTQPYSALAPYSQSFTSAAGCDSLVVLHLYVVPEAVTVFDTICEGDVYQIGTYTHTETGIYHDTIVSAKGCSQVYTVNLIVVDSTDTTVVTICAGESYTFEGQPYNQTGVYPVQTTGMNGCPLTKVLDLTVVQVDSTINVTFCEGGSVFVVDTVISGVGTYTLRRFSSEIGCTVVYTINATEIPAVAEDVFDYVCEGRNYTGHELVDVEIHQDTVITVNRRTADTECDSIFNVHITYVPTAYSDTTVTIKQGDSYTWNDMTFTEAGDYADTLQTEGEYICDSIARLHLVVVTGIENVTSVKIDVVPNPVAPGVTTYVYGDFEDIETVEILNNFGQVVDRFVPETYPIEVEGVQTSGLYYVRLVTKNGQVYTEKLIVK